jgi:hypothetical protein
MKVYFAGAPGGGSMGLCPREIELNSYWKHRLWSYYHLLLNNGKMPDERKRVDLFLDSGAYSAWAQGKEIVLDDYIEFIKEHGDVLDVYSNLDVIGDPEATWKNQRRMEKAGLNPVPVYHYGEDIKYLTKLLARGYEYISLGGMVPISTKDLIYWLDELFTNYLTDEYGMPIVKVHGFGLTSLRLMLRYPWFSVDSTSWVVSGRMGTIYIPRYRLGKWIYDEESWKVAVSHLSPNLKEKGKHISTMNKSEKDILLKYIHEKGYVMGESKLRYENDGYKPIEGERLLNKSDKDPAGQRQVERIIEPGISNKYQLRDELNILYFMDLEKTMTKWPWPFVKKDLQEKLF